MTSTHDTKLTPREQQAYDAVKKHGKSGAVFETLMTDLDVNAGSTLRPRLSKLKDMGLIKAVRQEDDARKVTYIAIKN